MARPFHEHGSTLITCKLSWSSSGGHAPVELDAAAGDIIAGKGQALSGI